MGRHGKFVIRIIVTLVIMSVCVSYFCELARQKRIQAITYSNFYKLPEESVDVIFLGTSHSQNAFIPQELYNEFGITSYNLSCPQQVPLNSYYWLKEALKTQKPKVIILDTFYLATARNGTITEPFIRAPIENMCWGTVKIEAIHSVCKKYTDQSELSYYLPNLRYHDRWKNLGEIDFFAKELASVRNFKGAYILSDNNNEKKFNPFKLNQITANQVLPLDEYIEKISRICIENNIKLILVKTPNASWTMEEHNSVKAFANENKVPFYDMNVDTVYSKTGFSYNKDIADKHGHTNLQGAIKLSRFIGKLLRDKYDLLPHKCETWETGKEAYEKVKINYKLRNEKNLNEYLSRLNKSKERYTIFIAVKDEASKHLSEKTKKLLNELGLATYWNDAFGKSYYAVIEGGKVLLDEMSAEKLSHTGSFYQSRYIYSIESAGKKVGSSCSIQINRKEKAKGKRGLNIVVFDNERQIVIDSVCFDTFDATNKISRVFQYSGIKFKEVWMWADDLSHNNKKFNLLF